MTEIGTRLGPRDRGVDPCPVRSGDSNARVRAARQAAELATATANRGRPMPVDALVGQVRICATDLLHAFGVAEPEATRMIRAAD